MWFYSRDVKTHTLGIHHRISTEALHHCFDTEVGEDLLDHHRLFDAGDDLDVAAAAVADLYVDVENSLQTQGPAEFKTNPGKFKYPSVLL